MTLSGCFCYGVIGSDTGRNFDGKAGREPGCCRRENAMDFVVMTPARRMLIPLGLAAALALTAIGCTQETQNQLGRSIQNWTGTDGVLDVLAGDKLYLRFIKIDKLSTAMSTNGRRERARPYRFGYGVLDRNQNMKVDPGETKVYFEVSDYSTSYVFYENAGN